MSHVDEFWRRTLTSQSYNVLDTWAENAAEQEILLVSEALMAVVENSVYGKYRWEPCRGNEYSRVVYISSSLALVLRYYPEYPGYVHLVHIGTVDL